MRRSSIATLTLGALLLGGATAGAQSSGDTAEVIRQAVATLERQEVHEDSLRTASCRRGRQQSCVPRPKPVWYVSGDSRVAVLLARGLGNPVAPDTLGDRQPACAWTPEAATTVRGLRTQASIRFVSADTAIVETFQSCDTLPATSTISICSTS